MILSYLRSAVRRPCLAQKNGAALWVCRLSTQALPSSSDQNLKFCIVGSGPAGFYTLDRVWAQLNGFASEGLWKPYSCGCAVLFKHKQRGNLGPSMKPAIRPCAFLVLSGGQLPTPVVPCCFNQCLTALASGPPAYTLWPCSFRCLPRPPRHQGSGIFFYLGQGLKPSSVWTCVDLETCERRSVAFLGSRLCGVWTGKPTHLLRVHLRPEFKTRMRVRRAASRAIFSPPRKHLPPSSPCNLARGLKIAHDLDFNTKNAHCPGSCSSSSSGDNVLHCAQVAVVLLQNVINQFTAVARDPRASFYGNVALGRDVSLQELRLPSATAKVWSEPVGTLR
eukprot:1148095-Pelagomonas_calceolata.AAC.1